LPRMRGLDSKVLVRLIEGLKGSPGYVAELSMMHRLMTRGVHSPGEGMRLGSLKAKYCKDHVELKTERQGQKELL
jgi:hypothetical protein